MLCCYTVVGPEEYDTAVRQLHTRRGPDSDTVTDLPGMVLPNQERWLQVAVTTYVWRGRHTSASSFGCPTGR